MWRGEYILRDLPLSLGAQKIMSNGNPAKGNPVNPVWPIAGCMHVRKLQLLRCDSRLPRNQSAEYPV